MVRHRHRKKLMLCAQTAPYYLRISTRPPIRPLSLNNDNAHFRSGSVLWRRYCGDGGIGMPSLDVLWRHAGDGGRSFESTPACMLDEAYDDIVDTLTKNHLNDYQV